MTGTTQWDTTRPLPRTRGRTRTEGGELTGTHPNTGAQDSSQAGRPHSRWSPPGRPAARGTRPQLARRPCRSGRWGCPPPCGQPASSAAQTLWKGQRCCHGAPGPPWSSLGRGPPWSGTNAPTPRHKPPWQPCSSPPEMPSPYLADDERAGAGRLRPLQPPARPAASLLGRKRLPTQRLGSPQAQPGSQ